MSFIVPSLGLLQPTGNIGTDGWLKGSSHLVRARHPQRDHAIVAPHRETRMDLHRSTAWLVS